MSEDTSKCFVLNALCSKAKQLRIVLIHGIRPDFLEIHLPWVESFTTSKMDRHLLHQKNCQRISVMKTNTAAFVVFKTRRELKCQFYGIIEIL